jgi:hypothetical protein
VTISRRDAIARFAGLFTVALVRLPPFSFAAARNPLDHPEPRPGITGEHVLLAGELPKKKSIVAAYDAARTYPEIFDGILCACDCKGSMGHRSLLSCFESKQPVGCMACREIAESIESLAKDGKSLAEIRQAVDKEFG